MNERPEPDDELERLGRELQGLPTPLPPPALVARARRQGHLALARRAERARQRSEWAALALLLLFSWIVSLGTFAAVRAVGAGPAASWVLVWSWGASATLLIALHTRRERRLS